MYIKKTTKKKTQMDMDGRLEVAMIGVAYMGSWITPFKFEILNIIVKAWS
jgi:hypothetical protein